MTHTLPTGSTRCFLTSEPTQHLDRPGWGERGRWHAQWIDHPARAIQAPSVALFRRTVTVEEDAVVRIHVSADNRYRLFLDGTPLGRGPERGDPLHWRYESYDLTLPAGEHTLLAQTWWLADQAPYAQMTIRPGFLLEAEGAWDDLLSTGRAPWEAALMAGYTFVMSTLTWGTGAKIIVDGAAFPWGWEDGQGVRWQPAVPIAPGMTAGVKNETPACWQLTPATLPPMQEARVTAGLVRHLADGGVPDPVRAADHRAEEAAAWQRWLASEASLTVPAHTTRRAIIDLQNYYCAYPELRVSGGAGTRISLQWAEALFVAPPSEEKGHRDEIEGKYFVGAGDVFRPDGGANRIFTTLWWAAGRYLELRVETGAAPLTLEAFTLLETHYPLEMAGHFAAEDPRLAAVIPLGLRTLQMCAHETYLDCPYYEQLMYVGDTRLEVLTTYVLTRDDRLPRKALCSFDDSRRLSGFTQSRFPSTVTQIIPPFSLWWVGMVHDYWRWRDDPALVRRLLPGVRGVLEGFRACLREDGLLGAPNGWNFTDWVPGWTWGVPPDGEFGVSAVLNAHLALILAQQAELEEAVGETALAARDRATAARVLAATLAACWDEARGLLADTPARVSFSEHAQCLALLSGLLPAAVAARMAEGLFTAPELARATIYFSHYLFEVCAQWGRGDRILDALTQWFALSTLGFTTTRECPEPSRSDCHAWGAHPIFHYYASLLGIRPAAAGFRRVRIAPALGALAWAEGTLPHPQGEISVRLRRDGVTLHAEVILPPGISGVLVWHGVEHPLPAGESRFTG